MSATRIKRLVCDCQGTMVLDGQKLSDALGLQQPLRVYRELCRSQLSVVQDALADADGEAGQLVQVACRQECALFQEVADDVLPGESRPLGADGADNIGASAADIVFTDVRDCAGWTEAGKASNAKMAALLAADAILPRPAPSVSLVCEGVCLVYGRGQAALDSARRLGDRLSVSVLLSDPDDALPPAHTEQTIHRGRIARAAGHLGAFDIIVDGYAALLPSSKAELQFTLPRDGAKASCHIIVDLSGGAPLFAADGRRDGYVRADPDSPVDVADALFKAADLIGTFEKPRYVTFDADICAHSRSGIVGCTNCLDVCPVGAISPDGDHVAIDTAICGGCGNCAAVCPTGAASYAVPGRGDLLTKLDVLLATYLDAGGTAPVVLLADETHGRDVVNALARFGRGLPANVLPVYLQSVLSVGHETLIGAITLGADRVVALPPPARRNELGSLEMQSALANAFLDGLSLGADRVTILDADDPDQIEGALFDLPAVAPPVTRRSASFSGTKRDIARTVLGHLHDAAPTAIDALKLPTGAPYGRIIVETEGCTLCLSCVGACPANALSDAPDRPQVAFTEAACVQCGVCVATCPENVIRLEPRYLFTTEALSPVMIKSEEPFHCIVCDAPFGTRSTINAVLERLRGHAMFASDDKMRLIQMCDTCRVTTLANSNDDPFRSNERPRVRTTDDDLAERAAGGKPLRDLDPDDFLS